MSSNDQPTATLGLQLEDGDTHNPASTTLSVSNALTDQNSSSIAQSSSAPALAGGSTTFNLFVEFPTEIRLLIWNFAVPAHQRHRITNNAMKHNVTHSRENPAILYANSESREVAKKHLKLLFDGINMIGISHFKYFNPASDTIFFDALPDKFLFSVSPYPFKHGDNYKLLEPFKECDDIHDIALIVYFTMPFSEGHGPNFRNLERVRLLSTRSYSRQFPSDQAGRRAFVRRIFLQYAREIIDARLFFSRRLELGLVSRVPHISISLTRADWEAVKLTGSFGEIYFGQNLKYLKN